MLALTLFIVVFIMLAVLLARIALFPAIRFVKPTGPFGIGTLTYHVKDGSRTEIFQEDPRAPRELIVQVWYPAAGEASAERAPYLPDARMVTKELARLFRVPRFLFHHIRRARSNAISSAPAASPGGDGYPVLIFLEGLAGFRQMNTFQVEELVSHGYIVAAIDHPYAAACVVFPDGRHAAGYPIGRMKELMAPSLEEVAHPSAVNGHVLKDGIIPYFAEDVRLVLDELGKWNEADPFGILTGKMDLRRIGVFGVSLGGIVAGEVCQAEARLKACLIIDAPMSRNTVANGLRQPAMWITRDAETMRQEGWSEKDIDQHQTTMRAVFERMPSDGYFVQVPDYFHINPTDIPCWWPLLTRLVKMRGRIDWKRAHAITNDFTLAFFNKYLKGVSGDLLECGDKYPEVTLEESGA
jgi:Predicted dienelactone hydrolase